MVGSHFADIYCMPANGERLYQGSDLKRQLIWNEMKSFSFHAYVFSHPASIAAIPQETPARAYTV